MLLTRTQSLFSCFWGETRLDTKVECSPRAPLDPDLSRNNNLIIIKTEIAIVGQKLSLGFILSMFLRPKGAKGVSTFCIYEGTASLSI